jgi:hypothetical protein
MLREFMIPLTTLCCCAVVSIAGLDRLCLFHQTYQSMEAKLQSERWLLEQCSDPHFFSKMHQHSDICFQACPCLFPFYKLTRHALACSRFTRSP